MYSPSLGRFIQRDPAGFVDGTNVYAAYRNSPVNWVDPWGLSPTQEAAVSLEEFIKKVREYEAAHAGEDPCDILDGLVDLIKGASGQQGNWWVYVYSDQVGWIDMGHFMTAASYQWVHSDIRRIAGVAVEYCQVAGIMGLGSGYGESSGEYYSAFSHEDIISNEMGIQFSDQWDCSSGGSVADALENYLKSIGVGDVPRGAPSYENLPQNDAGWESRNSWYDPYLRALDFTVTAIWPASIPEYAARITGENLQPTPNNAQTNSPIVNGFVFGGLLGGLNWWRR